MRNVIGRGFENQVGQAFQNDAGHEFENKFGSWISERVTQIEFVYLSNKGLIEDYITKGG